jgi:hypothetical protein
VNPAAYPREPTLAELLAGLLYDATALLRQELALAKHELRAEFWHIIRALMCLGAGAGIAAIGGWLLILMLVHLLQALTALPLWACYGLVGGLFAVVGGVLLVLGKRKLARLHLVPQDTVETMKENIRWVTARVTVNGRSTKGGTR